MTKEEIENCIYNKIIEIGVDRALSNSNIEYDETIFKEATRYFQYHKSWYIDMYKDPENGYHSIQLNSWSINSDKDMPDISLYVSGSDINDDIVNAVRKIKLEEILD